MGQASDTILLVGGMALSVQHPFFCRLRNRGGLHRKQSSSLPVDVCVFVLVSLGSWAGIGWAQDAPNPSELRVNYVYAGQLGFGAYELGGLSVQVYKLPLAYTFDFGKGPAWQVKVKLPVLYGRYQFKTTQDGGDQPVTLSHTVESLSIVPGVELQLPLHRRWALKPFAEWGPIKDFSGGPWSHVYAAGVRSLFSSDWRRFQVNVGNALLYAGNTTFSGNDEEGYGVLETGLEVRHPLGFWLQGAEPDLGGFFIHSHFFPSADFTRLARNPLKLHNQYEFGCSFGAEPSWKLGFVTVPRIGVSYRFGGLDAIRLTFGFPF